MVSDVFSGLENKGVRVGRHRLHGRSRYVGRDHGLKPLCARVGEVVLSRGEWPRYIGALSTQFSGGMGGWLCVYVCGDEWCERKEGKIKNHVPTSHIPKSPSIHPSILPAPRKRGPRKSKGRKANWQSLGSTVTWRLSCRAGEGGSRRAAKPPAEHPRPGFTPRGRARSGGGGESLYKSLLMLGADAVASWGKVSQCVFWCFGRWRSSLRRWGGLDAIARLFSSLPYGWLVCFVMHVNVPPMPHEVPM